jgi:hypothetical protein
MTILGIEAWDREWSEEGRRANPKFSNSMEVMKPEKPKELLTYKFGGRCVPSARRRLFVLVGYGIARPRIRLPVPLQPV